MQERPVHDDQSTEARFDPNRDGWRALEAIAALIPERSRPAICVLIVIARHSACFHRSTCSIGQAQLAHESGISRRHLRRTLQELVETGDISIPGLGTPTGRRMTIRLALVPARERQGLTAQKSLRTGDTSGPVSLKRGDTSGPVLIRTGDTSGPVPLKRGDTSGPRNNYGLTTNVAAAAARPQTQTQSGGSPLPDWLRSVFAQAVRTIGRPDAPRLRRLMDHDLQLQLESGLPPAEFERLARDSTSRAATANVNHDVWNYRRGALKGMVRERLSGLRPPEPRIHTVDEFEEIFAEDERRQQDAR